eukprot:scaffold34631_cov251-Amphora_coffeaeformis.AAC.11
MLRSIPLFRHRACCATMTRMCRGGGSAPPSNCGRSITTPILRAFATSRQKRSGMYKEPDQLLGEDQKPLAEHQQVKEDAIVWNADGQARRASEMMKQQQQPKILLPNTDLQNFTEMPSLLHDTPYTTLENLQRGTWVDETNKIGGTSNNTTGSSTSTSIKNPLQPTVGIMSDLGALKDLYDPKVHLSATAPSDWSDYEPATPLWEEMAAWIGVAGRPMSVADCMRLCLTHPAHGYYTQATSVARTTTAVAADAGGGGVQDDFDVDEWAEEEEEDDNKNTSASKADDLIIGPGGDFVTAPEMSQIFGECLGVWCMTVWQLMAPRPTAWQWLEAGPGKGSLMADLIRFTFSVDKIRDTFGHGCRGIHFIEQSPRLRQVQRETLQKDVGHLVNFSFPQNDKGPAETTESKDKPNIPVYWHDTLASFQFWQHQNDSFLSTFAICQEFLDALPVYVFEKTKEGWRERLVDIAIREDVEMDNDDDDNNTAALAAAKSARDASMEKLKHQKKPRLRLVTAPEVTPAAKTLLKVDPETGLMANEDPPAPIGTVMEVNPEGILLVQELARIVDKQGGGALVIDYGQEGSHDSIRAFARHEQVHFLSRPGQVDVTADVDFAALRQGVNSMGLKGAQAFGPVLQGNFLMSMGAQDRAIHLIENDNTSAEEAENIYQALVRLCDPAEMGERFKVLSIAKKKDDIFQPPGF